MDNQQLHFSHTVVVRIKQSAKPSPKELATFAEATAAVRRDLFNLLADVIRPDDPHVLRYIERNPKPTDKLDIAVKSAIAQGCFVKVLELTVLRKA